MFLFVLKVLSLFKGHFYLALESSCYFLTSLCLCFLQQATYKNDCVIYYVFQQIVEQKITEF